jgi:drug/metabolite transporter (DMT)-like permease
VSPVVIGLVLFAAILHATWNAVLKGGADRLKSITIMSVATTIVAIPLAIVLPIPSPPSWPYLAMSSILQVAYSVFLVRAYRYGALGDVYPIVRGSVPLLVTAGGFVLTTQRPSTLALAGVVFVASGIMSLAFGKASASKRSIALAFVTSLFIAGYVTTDGIGVRLAGNSRSYATWIFLIYGILMPGAFVVLRGNLSITIRSSETLKALAGGVVSLLAYAATISALAFGPIGPISALRETSVVFALIIGRIFLGEPLTSRRLAACAAVALGAVLISF